jgi:uncharacterized iron-regulated membrane protein
VTARLRSVIFWLHLAAGVVAGSVILIMSVTGVLLTYERQILEWADRGYRSAPPAGASRLPVEDLLARAAAARPDAKPTGITLQADPAAPAQVALGRGRSVYLNPYSGQVLGEGAPKARKFFRAVTDWHRWLAAKEDNRKLGRAVTGASNLAFLFLVVSGIYLWVPRKWTWIQFKNVTWFRRGLSAKARDFNWHNTIGLWAWVPLFFIVLSGVLISYPWAGDLLYRLTGEEPPARQEPGGRRAEGPRAEGRARGGAAGAGFAGLDGPWAVAERRVPGWKTLSVRLPEEADAPWAFTVLEGHRGRPDLRSQLTLDREGREVKWEPFAGQGLARRLRSWGRWIHTGEALGVVGQTVAGIASGGAVVLVWTGIALACRRLFRRAQKPVKVREERPDAPPGSVLEA